MHFVEKFLTQQKQDRLDLPKDSSDKKNSRDTSTRKLALNSANSQEDPVIALPKVIEETVEYCMSCLD